MTGSHTTRTALPAAEARRLLAGYLASDLLSLLGNAVIVVVLPLLVLSRTGSPAAAGVVLAAGTVPAILAGILGGALVDRFDRRRVSIAADLVSTASVGALPVVDALWGLDLAWFVALGAIGAFGDPPGMTAREALAPAVSARCGLPVDRLVAMREALGATVMIVGPGLAGALIWLMPEQGALWVTAATSAAAALATAALPASIGSYERSDAAARRPAGAIRQSLDGFRLLAKDPVLRALVGLTVVGGAAIGCLQGLLLPVHFAALGRPELLGTVLVALAAGLLAGAAGYAALAGRLAAPTWFHLGIAVSLVGMVGIATLPGLAPSSPRPPWPASAPGPPAPWARRSSSPASTRGAWEGRWAHRTPSCWRRCPWWRCRPQPWRSTPRRAPPASRWPAWWCWRP